MTTPQSPQQSPTPALAVVGVMFVVTVVAVLLAFLFAPPERDLTLVIGPLLGTLAPTIAAVALLAQVRDVKAAQAVQGEQIDKVASDTHALTNGLLDSKVRAAIADTTPEHMLDPDYVEEQLHADRRARDAAHNGDPD